MAYSEAIAHGLPVVGTSRGAIPDTVPANAGILVEPDDVPAFAVALRRLIADADERKRLAAAARAAAAKLPTWQELARKSWQRTLGDARVSVDSPPIGSRCASPMTCVRAAARLLRRSRLRLPRCRRSILSISLAALARRCAR